MIAALRGRGAIQRPIVETVAPCMLAILEGIPVLAMKTTKGLLGFFAAIVMLSVQSAFAQAPPPNDDFANRTVLAGSAVTFSGSLAGATLETAENHSAYYSIPSGATGSVWWTWTAQASSTAVISAIRAQDSYNHIAVYTGTDLNSLTIINYESFQNPAGRYLRFDAVAGTSYQIQLVGFDTQPFSIQLTATNAPVFIFQPQDCTVSPYGSAFFSAMASGPRTFLVPPTTTYQWFFNGAPLPRQTFPSLLVHGVTTNQAGSYSVIASNVDGIAQSAVATLAVSDTNPVPRIASMRPNNPNLVTFTLTGEGGRWYQIESSQDLRSWTTSAWIQLTNATSVVSVPRAGPNHFVRASLDVPTDVCVAQLKQMRWALTVFAIEREESESSTYSLFNIMPYVPLNSQGLINYCPEGGTYWPGATITNAPTCTLQVRGHVIPDL